MAESSYQRQAKATTDWMIARIETALETGEKLTWAHGHDLGLPRNFATGRYYRGWNVFRCWMAGFERPLFVGLRQVVKLGGRVRREEMTRPTWIMLWNRREVDDGTDKYGAKKTRSYWYSKALKVYNVAQCDGLDESKFATLKEAEGAEHDAELDAFFGAYADADGLKVKYEAEMPFSCYVPELDEVRMPPRASFYGTTKFYGELAHEFVHATGADKRLKRGDFGMGWESYSKEELVAEFGAAILAAVLGFEVESEKENHAAYLRGWLTRLKDDPTLLCSAASAAQKAVDRIMEKAGHAVPAFVGEGDADADA